MIAITYLCPPIITAVNFSPCKFTQSPCVFCIYCGPLLCCLKASGVLICWVCCSCRSESLGAGADFFYIIFLPELCSGRASESERAIFWGADCVAALSLCPSSEPSQKPPCPYGNIGGHCLARVSLSDAGWNRAQNSGTG